LLFLLVLPLGLPRGRFGPTTFGLIEGDLFLLPFGLPLPLFFGVVRLL